MNLNNKTPKTFKVQHSTVRVGQLLSVRGRISQGDLIDSLIHGFDSRIYELKTQLGRRYDFGMEFDEAVIKSLLDLDNAVISQQEFDAKMEELRA